MSSLNVTFCLCVLSHLLFYWVFSAGLFWFSNTSCFFMIIVFLGAKRCLPNYFVRSSSEHFFVLYVPFKAYNNIRYIECVLYVKKTDVQRPEKPPTEKQRLYSSTKKDPLPVTKGRMFLSWRSLSFIYLLNRKTLFGPRQKEEKHKLKVDAFLCF